MSKVFNGAFGIVFKEARQIATIKNFIVKISRDGTIRVHIPEIENFTMDLLMSAFNRPLPYLTIQATIDGQSACMKKAKIDKLTVNAKPDSVWLTNVNIVALTIEWQY